LFDSLLLGAEAQADKAATDRFDQIEAELKKLRPQTIKAALAPPTRLGRFLPAS
jgi:hypothetical protein